MDLGDTIKTLREGKGWTQDELARKVGVARSYISLLECRQRHNISWDILRRLADALGVTLDYFGARPVSDTDDLLDADFKQFFSGDWRELTDEEKDWLRRTIRMIRERKAERERKR